MDVRVCAVLYEEHEGQALHQTSLDFHLDHLGQQPYPFFIFPLTFYHPLDRQSPLYPALCEGTSNHFELVVFLSALQEGTGDSCQKRTSYLRQEILFDRCFVPALGLDARGRYMVSTQHFETTHSKEPLNKECVVQINGDGSDRMEWCYGRRPIGTEGCFWGMTREGNNGVDIFCQKVLDLIW